MSSRDRVFAALEGRIPDRVPLMEIAIDPKVINSIAPGMSYEDFCDHADIDAVTCLTMADDPADIHWLDQEQRLWCDKWGARQVLTQDLLSLVTPPARIEAQAELDAYQPPDPATAPVIGRARKLVQRFKGRRAVVVVGEATFAPSQYLRAGLENLMLDYALRPDFVRRLARIGMDYHVELYRRLIAEGVEIVLLGDDYAGKTGTFMSPAHFAEFVLPGVKTVVEAIKQAGAYCIVHTDGDIWKILDMLIATGIDMLGPLEPPYMQLDQVRKHSGGRVGVMGNVPLDLLSRGSTQAVRAATWELIARVSPLGGHILSSANTIASSVRGENFMAMLEAAREYGRYPINITCGQA